MADALKIERSVFISAPAEKIWEVIVTPELSNQFFPMPLGSVGSGVGGEMVYVGARRRMTGMIQEYEPGKRLVHSWSDSHYPDDPPSRVTYQIDDLGDMCKLTMIHDGFASETSTFRDVMKGWEMVLANLKLFTETGTALPY